MSDTQNIKKIQVQNDAAKDKVVISLIEQEAATEDSGLQGEEQRAVKVVDKDGAVAVGGVATVGSKYTLAAESALQETSGVGKKQRKRRRKNECHYKDCSSSYIKYIGECQYCEGRFCSQHRLLETHLCTKLDYCKKEYHRRNAVRLAKEQTKIPKLSSI
ncbi:hypothetical protein TPHA_0L02070 [Tetrapisispora phaffii CBS 4417]|uniref:AN1-type domain-containing protein n=1 Tax=Tetrapisispora phaffii (strain ATCC 24235 / CBS 4417 / NBRC 1672 / NRRL Y-8282 / UCD 70-5) TaxID=1071381 RepID=G8C081_TETPH|nr:hypothetical protein TPHA_0L02070 [Tetrapisispora phaffii CBS 4417]CCE65559.1 hypothetical protein TPHA_0L02070 [Tetrapisispora phaffii CBS 4417]